MRTEYGSTLETSYMGKQVWYIASHIDFPKIFLWSSTDQSDPFLLVNYSHSMLPYHAYCITLSLVVRISQLKPIILRKTKLIKQFTKLNHDASKVFNFRAILCPKFTKQNFNFNLIWFNLLFNIDSCLNITQVLVYMTFYLDIENIIH